MACALNLGFQGGDGFGWGVMVCLRRFERIKIGAAGGPIQDVGVALSAKEHDRRQVLLAPQCDQCRGDEFQAGLEPFQVGDGHGTQ